MIVFLGAFLDDVEVAAKGIFTPGKEKEIKGGMRESLPPTLFPAELIEGIHSL